MTSPLLAILAAIGPTSFTIIVWGSILLVLAVFGYVLWTLLADFQAE